MPKDPYYNLLSNAIYNIQIGYPWRKFEGKMQHKKYSLREEMEKKQQRFSYDFLYCANFYSSRTVTLIAKWMIAN